MAKTQKVLSESAQTFYSTRTSICMHKNLIKIGGDFGAIFWKKTSVVQGN